MTELRKIIRAFLGSPGDLQDEREAIRDVVKEWNDTWAAELGYQIELIGWEETIAGYGRPQHIINQELNSCDLFLGMIWKRWGTPPDDSGKYTSGFQEEFDRSVERRERTGKPEISLFFKNIDKDFLEDKGPDLNKVISFKEKIKSNRTILFQQFETTSNIRKLVRKCVSNYVNQVKKKEEEKAPEKKLSEIGRRPPDSAGTDTDEKVTSPLAYEGFNFLQKFIGKIQHDDHTMENITSCDIARFRLLANSISKNSNDKGSLGVHDINLIYANKNEITLGSVEIGNLQKFGFQHIKDENTPIWFFYAQRNKSTICPAMIYGFLINEKNVRAGAIKALTLLGTTPLEIEERLAKQQRPYQKWLSDESAAEVRLAALEYLRFNGGLEDYEIVLNEYKKSDYNTTNNALECMLYILHRHGENCAAEKVMIERHFNYLNSNILNKILLGFDKLSSEELMVALKHTSSKVRLSALMVLQERGDIKQDFLEHLLNDDYAAIRYESLNSLIQLGKTFGAKQVKEILIKPRSNSAMGLLSLGSNNSEGKAYYEQFKNDELYKLNKEQLDERIITSFLLEEENPYFIIAEKYFSKYAKDLRKNVDDRFKGYFNQRLKTILAVEKRIGKSKTLTEYNKSNEETIRIKLTRKGLNLLCKKRLAEDKERIITNLEKGYTGAQTCDSEYLRKFGLFKDAEVLGNAEYIKSENVVDYSDKFIDYQSNVAHTLYKLGKNSLSELFLMKLSSGILEEMLTKCSEASFRKIDEKIVLNLLSNENQALRKKASILAVLALSKTKIKRILKNYMNDENSTYYNVVHWLDVGCSMPREVAKMIVLRAGKIKA